MCERVAGNRHIPRVRSETQKALGGRGLPPERGSGGLGLWEGGRGAGGGRDGGEIPNRLHQETKPVAYPITVAWSVGAVETGNGFQYVHSP